ncbi:methyltransferase domain-containing protein [Mycobacterium interjectum]|uniref:methyltransferase domain-containing protein n=1 Tax=Mycobacterium interjectum TaxID=33895 RepID=UPI00082B5A9F|nr:methyltransferase domain-containing protein [Mycobacterium interjectum]MCV7091258.1 methyltransferase domain-containing protein [Mycobacterium interjectum]
MNARPAKYTHGHHESVLRSHQRRTAEDSAAYLLPHLKPGSSVLDIGCGPGTITADLAERVAAGTVLAVDQSADVLDVARAEIERRRLSNVTFQTADVHRLEFPDDSFDVVHAHQVLQHVADPVRALREMRRVCRPGGIVAARDADYGGFIWFPRIPGLDLWLDLYGKAHRANGGEPDAGRRLLSWALAAGFEDITPTGSVWCYATPQTRDWWGGMWADRILHSSVGRDLLASALATVAQLEEVAAAWRSWAAARDGWLSIPHGEILCRA